ncbi:MAG: mucin-2 protein [Nocardioides sp.]
MAAGRHKREPEPRRLPGAAFVAAPVAVMATVSTISLGVLGGGTATTADSRLAAASVETLLAHRQVLSRAESRRREKQVAEQIIADQEAYTRRVAREARTTAAAADASAIEQAVREADTQRYTTTSLNVWSASTASAQVLGEIEAGAKVLVTGRSEAGRVEVVWKGQARWVTAGYLSADKPVGPAAGLSMAPCPNTSVERGLTTNAIRVYRSVCHAFPQITSYGGWDAHGEHRSGRALDIMTSDVALGTAIATYLRAHAAELHLYDVIWRQHIWTPVRAGEGWRYMSSRGSATANHYDHVHVSTY